MNKLFNRFIFEGSANISLAFISTFAFQMLFFRKRIILVQGLALGLAAGISVNHANRNFENMNGKHSQAIINGKLSNQYLEYYK